MFDFEKLHVYKKAKLFNSEIRALIHPRYRAIASRD